MILTENSKISYEDLKSVYKVFKKAKINEVIA